MFIHKESDIYIAYIDGLNLFYKIKSLQNSNLKWLNIESFIRQYSCFKNLKLDRIKYFTAYVSEDDTGSLSNQQTYLEALKTLDKVEVIFGKFKKTYPKGYLCDENHKMKLPKEKVTIIKPEEKESDVNIGIHIISDCYELKNLKGIILVSSDTDQTPALKMVKEKFPYIEISHIRMNKRGSKSLQDYADFKDRIRFKSLKDSQFPDTLTNKKGYEIKKPEEWK